MGFAFRLAVLSAFAAITSAMSGCAELQARTSEGFRLERGSSALSEELDRLRVPGPFRYAEISPAEAVVIAREQRVVVRPVEGLCLSQGSLEVTREAAFAVVTDCLVEATRTESDALPPTFPGLLAVSVSGDPMFEDDEGRGTALRRLREFLGTEPGLALLGRNGAGSTVEMVEARQVGDALYVHVHDTHEGELRLLAPDFWRAFVELNGRLVMVTVSGFRDFALEPDAMLALLAGQLATLREANGGPAFEAELALAEGAGSAMRAVSLVRTDPSGGLDVLREQIASRRPAPARVPVPPRRPGTAKATVDETGTANAPRRAPLALARPALG
ncbi:MAG: hypothetical protein AAFR79_07340 [Pseudomonadota bacterium]